MASDKMFSKEALDRLRSPEKLNTMISVTTPIGWMGLAGICLLFFAVVLWSVFGSFTEKAMGMGLILDSAGVANVTHAATGKITDIYVKRGNRIKAGDLVARMDQPEQSADTRIAQYGMDLATNDRDVMGKVYQYGAKKHQETVRKNVYSDYDGIVDEVMVETGNIVPAGNPICTVRLTQNREELNGILYIPVDKGKRVEPGMSIQLAPNGVDVSQSGSLLGVVRSVSQYPISGESVKKAMGSSQLTQYVLNQGGGAVVEVRFDLVQDPGSESGYLWTSIVGEHKPVTAGSFCTGTIIIDRKPPIEKVFYKISQALRSR